DADPVSLVAGWTVRLRSDETLADGLAALERSGAAAVPVHGPVGSDAEDEVVGWLTYQATLAAPALR
ncbi:hypothetical protein ACFP8W_15870, partial [Nocardioides hankookensis]